MADPSPANGVKNTIERVEGSEEFAEMKKQAPDAYLAHLFCTHAGEAYTPWQVGYYDRTTDRVIVAEIAEAGIVIHPPQEVYKEPGHTILRLTIADVAIALEDVMRQVAGRMREGYPGELSNKEIVILQTLPEWGTIWNITALTTRFQVINFKFDAKTGKLIHEQRESLTTLPGNRDAPDA